MMVLAMIGLTCVQVQLLRNAWHLKEQAFDRNAASAVSLTVQQLEDHDFFDEAVALVEFDEFPKSTEPEIFFKKLTAEDKFPEEVALTDLDSLVFSSQKMSIFFAEGRHDRIEKVVGTLMRKTPRTLGERISKSGVDSLLAQSLESVGITMPPAFAVVASNNDSLVMANKSATFLPSDVSSYRGRLFPLDFLPPAFDLVVWFPDRRGFLLNQILPLALASLIFMSVVVISFWLNLRLIARQQRASESMVDFINNMTHEFKTPISTVQLASDAIAGEEFEHYPDSLRRYNSMIRQETRRMSLHAERILQFASLEDGRLVPGHESVAMHSLISESCSAFQLTLNSRNGRLNLNLEAEQDRVAGDASHLANVVNNLVDNAIKYSPDAPNVNVSTVNRPGWFVMRVTDRGLGIAPENQSRIFDRYFRCSTGNRHDVKGYGLGLSYVKLLVDAHGGRVEVTSQVGRGTTVSVSFPLEKTEASA